MLLCIFHDPEAPLETTQRAAQHGARLLSSLPTLCGDHTSAVAYTLLCAKRAERKTCRECRASPRVRPCMMRAAINRPRAADTRQCEAHPIGRKTRVW